MVYYKISILIVQRLALHQNWVEFCKLFNDAIRTSLTTLYDDVQRRTTSPKNLLHRDRDSQGHRENFEKTLKGLTRTLRELKEL